MNDPVIDGFKGLWYLLKVLVTGEPPKAAPAPFSIRELENRLIGIKASNGRSNS